MSADVDAEGLGECFNLKPYRNLVKSTWAPPPRAFQRDSSAAPAAAAAAAATAIAAEEGSAEAGAPAENAAAAAAAAEGESEPTEPAATAATDGEQAVAAESAGPDATLAPADAAASGEGESAAPTAAPAAEGGRDAAPAADDAPSAGDGASRPPFPSSLPPPGSEEGAPNAFRITLFCLAAQFDACAQDFWLHAFSCFPQREYGCLTVPSSVLAEPTLVRGLTAAATWPGVSFSHTLYVVHRDVLLAPRHLTVQRWLPSQAQVWPPNLSPFGLFCASLYDATHLHATRISLKCRVIIPLLLLC